MDRSLVIYIHNFILFRMEIQSLYFDHDMGITQLIKTPMIYIIIIIINAALSLRWIWISRSGSKRSTDNILGDEGREFVALGNLLAARFALLALLALVMGCFWLVTWLMCACYLFFLFVHSNQ